MDTLQAVILGAIQGLTEFIPISSSAHLLVIPWVFRWKSVPEDQKLIFDVALHLGTLFALVAYFWREWYDMIKAYLATTRFARKTAGNPGVKRSHSSAQGAMLWPVILASVPAGLAGFFFDEMIERKLRTPILVGVGMIVMGAILLLSDRVGSKSRPMYSVKTRDWLGIGLAQALALVPGVSRSGITITAGLFLGLEREAAARFSFLIGAPIILGAAVFKLQDLFAVGLAAHEVVPFLLGVITAAVVGYLCIGFLLDYLKRRSVDLFVAYRFLFGVTTLALYFTRT